MIFRLSDINEHVGGESVRGDMLPQLRGFSLDTRTLEPGDLYIAVKGECFDGHDFVEDAFRKGAAAVIVSDADKLKKYGPGTVIKVDSTIAALGKIASLIRRKMDIPVICITGTNGKTTVKDILRQILSEKYKVLCSKKSFNNLFGVALTLFDLTGDHEAAIFEIGTNTRGEINSLAGILKPDVGVITNIGYGHIEAFKDLSGVFLEKSALLRHLSGRSLAVLNKDDSFLSGAATGPYKIRYFGTCNGSDCFISGITKKNDGYVFLVNGREFYLPVCGRHNIFNAAAAICTAEYMGVEYDMISNALRRVFLPEMRLTRFMAGNVLFINDAYNANPCSFISALKAVKYDITAPKKGIVAGDMLELGESSRQLHSRVGKKIADLNFDFFIALGKGASIMLEAAVNAGMPIERTEKVNSHKEAAAAVKKFADKDSAVLLKGSRKSKMEDVVTCYMNYSMD